MIKLIFNIIRSKLNKRKLHKQFLKIQKWQNEMYNKKSKWYCILTLYIYIYIINIIGKFLERRCIKWIRKIIY